MLCCVLSSWYDLMKTMCPDVIKYAMSTHFASKWANFQVFLNAEFLNVTVTRSCDGAKFLGVCSKSWELYGQTKNLCILTSFFFFFFMIHTHYVILGEIFALFLVQNFQKLSTNLLLKFLPQCSLGERRSWDWVNGYTRPDFSKERVSF